MIAACVKRGLPQGEGRLSVEGSRPMPVQSVERMSYYKYSEVNLYAAQEIYADFYEGRWTMREAVAYLRTLQVHDHRIITELFQALNGYVHDTAAIDRSQQRARAKAQAKIRVKEIGRLRLYAGRNRDAIDRRARYRSGL